MKKWNIKIKQFFENKGYMFFISVFFLLLWSLIPSLADYDFATQSYLGKLLVTEHRMDGLQDLIWGTKGIDGVFLNHEWLTNILFYVCINWLGEFYGVVFLKVLIVLFCTISMYYLLKTYLKDYQKMTWTTYFSCLLILYPLALGFLKVKAYDFTFCFLICLLILLEKYRHHEISDKWLTVWLVVLVIFWNNMHSGSAVVFFIVTILYWLFFSRKLKLLAIGIGCGLCLLLNPYGINMWVFNLQHFFDSDMKIVIRDWKALALDGSSGLNAFIYLSILLGFLHLLHMARTLETKYYVCLFVVFTYMTLSSLRHALYLYPVLMIIYAKGQFEFFTDRNIKIKVQTFIVPTLCIVFCMFTIITYWWVFLASNVEYRQKYMNHYITANLKNVIVDNMETNDGLYTQDIDVCSIGLKAFYTPAFTYNRERTIATYKLLLYSPKVKEQIIEDYQLDKFLIHIYQHTMLDGEQPSSLYEYLSDNSDKYVKLYEDKECAYFVKK